MSEFTTVARVGDVPPGEGRAFAYNGRMVAVFLIDDRYQAVDDFCPHMGASLAAGPVENGMVMCPWHAWCFQLSNGQWVENPRIKVDTFRVRVVDRNIQIAEQPSSDSPEDAGQDAAENPRDGV